MRSIKEFFKVNKSFFEIAWKECKSYYFIYIIMILYGFASNMLLVLLPKISLNCFYVEKKFKLGVAYICGYIMIVLIWAFVERQMTLKQDINVTCIRLKMRDIIYKKVNQNSMLAYEDSDEFDALQRALNYTDTGADELINVVSRVVTCILTLIGVSFVVGQVSILMVIIVFLALIVSHLCMRKVNDLWFKYQNNERLPKVRLINYLSGLWNDKDYVSTIKLNDAFNYSTKVLKSKTIDLTKEGVSKNRQRFKWNYISIIANNLQLLSVHLYFGYLLFKGALDIATYSSLFVAVQQFASNFDTLLNLFIEIRNNANEASFYMGYIKDQKYIQNGKKDIKEFEEIHLVNVGFKYPNQEKNALYNISFSIQAGEKIAIVGENGAGKSTLLKLILGLYYPSKGRIVFNENIDITDIDLSSWYSHVAVVMQNSTNIPLTIEENISLCDEKDTDSIKLEESILFSGLTEKINSLSKREKTVFSTRFDKNGVDFSGGEKQKVSIARAYYRKANVLIFDEPSSALDPNAEYDFFKKVYDLGKEKTIIFISHRLSTVVKADKIIVLDKGKIVGLGNHKELINKCDIYTEMFNKQAENYIGE
jgi:ABC transporter, ATP-binding protein